MTCCPERIADQRGAVALASSLLLLSLITTVILAAIQIALSEQRSLRSEVEMQMAYAWAELVQQRGLAYLGTNFAAITSTTAPGWSVCSSSRITPPCGDGVRNRYDSRWTAYTDAAAAAYETAQGGARLHLLARAAIAGQATPDCGAVCLVSVIGEGYVAGSDARALLRQDLLMAPLLAQFPEAPLMATRLSIAGSASIVANPRGASGSLPLSVWTAGDARLLGGARSCTATDASAVQCATPSVLSDASREAADWLDVDGGIGLLGDSGVASGDIVERVLGLATTQWSSLRDLARRLDDCATLDASASGLYWIDGACRLPARAIGTTARPLLLIVNGGRIEARGGVFNGLLLLLASNSGVTTPLFDDDFVLNGALAANGAIEIASGRFMIRHDAAVADALVSANGPRLLMPVPGSWRDF